MSAIIILFVSFVFSNYQVGQTISDSDQNINFPICYNDELAGNNIKLADYNGDLNGGHYNIVLVDMSATW